jgi:hypothetical protein
LRHGQTVYPLLRELCARRIPYALTTAPGAREIIAMTPETVVIRKVAM